jgi:hypothetical protein
LLGLFVGFVVGLLVYLAAGVNVGLIEGLNVGYPSLFHASSDVRRVTIIHFVSCSHV